MSTVIEARRLNNTDLGKTISFPETEGELRAVMHGFVTGADIKPRKYVSVIVNAESHILAPSDKITITGIKKQETKP